MEVELTIVVGAKCHGNIDVQILPHGVGLWVGLPRKWSVGGVHGMKNLARNGCAMSSYPNCDDGIVGRRNVNVDDEVDVHV